MAILGIHNIGKVLELKLDAVGIDTFDKLKETGTEKAFLMLLANNKNTSRSILYAIEGAITGVRWHNLNQERKDELKNFYDSVYTGAKK